MSLTPILKVERSPDGKVSLRAGGNAAYAVIAAIAIVIIVLGVVYLVH